MSRKLISLIACLVFVYSFVVVQTPVQAEGGDSISGTVYEDDGETPISDVHVVACSDGDNEICYETYSDGSGDYTIAELPLDETEYRVYVWGQPGWSNEFWKETVWWHEATLVKAGATGIDFTLLPAGTISGTVTDADGNPLANMGVDIMDGGYGDCTENDGSYSIVGLPFGTYDIVAGRDFCGPSSYVEQVIEAVTIDEDTPNVSGKIFTLELGGSISGFVTDTAGNPLPNIGVDIMDGGYGACTDEDGYYLIRRLPFGAYDIVAGRDFCGPHSYIEQVVSGVTIDTDTPDINLNFALELGGSISGTVTDTYDNLVGTGEGIDISACLFDDENVCWWADVVDGSYLIRGLPFGDYRVRAYQYPGGFWVEEYYKNTLVWEDSQPVKIKPINGKNKKDKHFNVTGIDFTLELGGSISGTVNKEGTDAPIGGIGVEACEYDDPDWDGPCFYGNVEADGNYIIYGVPVGTYRVKTGWDGNWVEEFYPGTINWDLAEPVDVLLGTDTSDINFTLELGGSISGWVTEDGTGAPIEGIGVEACEYDDPDWDGPCFYGGTEADGSYLIRGIPVGTYRVKTGWDGNWVEEFYPGTTNWELAEPVDVLLDANISGINFILMEGGTISGKVYEANSGEPLATIAGVRVNACSTDGTFCKDAETNGAGEYTIVGLLPDKTYHVGIWGQPGWANEVYFETIWWDDAAFLSVGATGIDFTLDPGGTISGVVTYGENPLTNIAVDITTGGYGTCTDENGNYTIAGLPFGTYDIVAGRDFCGSHPYAEQFMQGIAIDADNPDMSGIDFELAMGSTISGIVTDEFDAHIPERIDVAACWVATPDVCFWTTVLADNTYTITGLPSGEFFVNVYEVTDEGVPSVWIGDTTYPDIITLGVDEDKTDINFKLAHE